MLDKPTESDCLNQCPQWRTNLKFAQAGFAPQLACLFFYRWERRAQNWYHDSVTRCTLGEEGLLRLSSTIHKFMPVKSFLLEENQITHTFWKLLMTAFQSASGWLSTVICIFIYSSYIKKFTPVRPWQSVSIPNLFREVEWERIFAWRHYPNKFLSEVLVT